MERFLSETLCGYLKKLALLTGSVYHICTDMIRQSSNNLPILAVVLGACYRGLKAPFRTLVPGAASVGRRNGVIERAEYGLALA